MLNAVSELHSSEPSIAHGHITPCNVFLEESTAYLADFGFDYLRKYASLFHNYSNKSAYTAPELLKEKGNIINAKTIKADIYSIGVMIW